MKVAIIGSGNIGTDLMIKVMRRAKHLDMGAMVAGSKDTMSGSARCGLRASIACSMARPPSLGGALLSPLLATPSNRTVLRRIGQCISRRRAGR